MVGGMPQPPSSKKLRNGGRGIADGPKWLEEFWQQVTEFLRTIGSCLLLSVYWIRVSAHDSGRAGGDLPRGVFFPGWEVTQRHRHVGKNETGARSEIRVGFTMEVEYSVERPRIFGIQVTRKIRKLVG